MKRFFKFRNSLHNTRLGKLASRMGKKIKKTRLGKRLYRKRIPKEKRKEFVNWNIEWLGHDLKAMANAVFVPLETIKLTPEEKKLSKRISSFYPKAREIDRKTSKFYNSIGKRSSLKERIEKSKKEMPVLLKKASELKGEIEKTINSGLAKTELGKEALSHSLISINSYIEFLELLRKRNFSPEPKLERIGLEKFVKRIAKSQAAERIGVSVNISPKARVLMDKLELERCIRTVVRNSVEHSPNTKLEINAYLEKVEGGKYVNLDFLSVGGKKLPKEIVSEPGSYFSTSGKTGKGHGTTIVFNLLRRYEYELKAENTPRGPKFTMVFKVPEEKQ